ncbi:MAG: tryptophan--tRNA ligase [Candidatus Lokiarchaeota archaeon]|nr:tryptophan--tRNA ligase [Candidatus Lokiarchaeota archaeon]
MVDNNNNNSKGKLKDKLDPWGSNLIEDYKYLMDEFGIDDFAELKQHYPNPNHLIRRNIIFGHRGFGNVLNAIIKNKKFNVLSGIKPTGPFHLGTLTTAWEIVDFQKQGGKAFYCIADLEAYEDNGIVIEDSLEIAVDNIADVLALGLDYKNAYIYRQSKEERVKDMAFEFSRGVTLNMLKAIYGLREFGLYMTAMVQVGDILLPQLEDFGGPAPTVIPVGVDQDPHIRLTRDIAKKFKKYNFIPPAATYHKLMRGLDGSEKMSKRNPMSSFTLNEEIGSIKKKLNNSFTGGRNTAEEQRELGGQPHICNIYDLYKYHFISDDEELEKIYKECISGEILCGYCKKRAIEKITEFIKDHQKKKEKMIDKAREILETRNE